MNFGFEPKMIGCVARWNYSSKSLQSRMLDLLRSIHNAVRDIRQGRDWPSWFLSDTSMMFLCADGKLCRYWQSLLCGYHPFRVAYHFVWDWKFPLFSRCKRRWTDTASIGAKRLWILLAFAGISTGSAADTVEPSAGLSFTR